MWQSNEGKAKQHKFVYLRDVLSGLKVMACPPCVALHHCAGLHEQSLSMQTSVLLWVLLQQEKTEFERFDAALDAVPALARPDTPSATLAAELAETAVPLTRTLLHLEDRFHTAGFGTRRRAALIAVCIGAPAVSGPYLARQVP